jgi:hypothetical protein
VTNAAQEVVDLAAAAGLVLDPWQVDVLNTALGERADGRWAATEVGLVCPRQNGKGAILEALELAALVLWGCRLVVHTAHEFKTANEAFLRVRQLFEGSDELMRLVKQVRTANGEQGIEMRSGQRLKFLARSSGSGRGFSGDLVILDEAYELRDAAMAALLPTMSARPNPQIWYTSSAPLAGVESEVLRRLCRRGRASSDSLAFVEYAAAERADLDDRDAWAAANPGFGARITEDFIALERAALTEDDFARERLGLWAEVNDAGGAFDLAAWKVLADAGAERGERPTFGLAVAPDRSWAAISVAWKRDDGATQVMVADYRRTTTWVADRVKELTAQWGGKVFAADDAADLADDVERVTGADVKRAEQAFDDALTAGTVRHGNQPSLNLSIEAANWRKSGEGRLLDRAGAVDISPLVAAALALANVGDDAPPNIW